MPTLRSHNDNVCCDRTVSQNDQGILPGFSLSHLPTVVVLSSGGYGHIELPLIKGSIPQSNESTAAFKKTVPYKHVVSFAGDTGTAPNQLRIRMQIQTVVLPLQQTLPVGALLVASGVVSRLARLVWHIWPPNSTKHKCGSLDEPCSY